MAVAVIGEGIGNYLVGSQLMAPDVAGYVAVDTAAVGSGAVAAGIAVDPTLVAGLRPFHYPKK
jgi:hypothetical protein